jgi:hypothetical protein
LRYLGAMSPPRLPGFAALFACFAMMGCGADAAPPSQVAIRVEPATSGPGTSAPPQPEGVGPCLAEPSHSTTEKPAVDPAAELPECAKDRRAPICRFTVARAYLDAERYERAAPLFIALALDPQSSAIVAPTAAEYALDAMLKLAKRAEPQRPDCWAEVDRAVAKLHAALCGARRAANLHTESACKTLGGYILRVRVAHAYSMAQLDLLAPPLSREQHEKAGDAFWAIATDYCFTGTVPEEPRCDHMLFNAYHSYRAANLPAKAAQAKAALLDPKNGVHTSEVAKEAALDP